MALPRTLARFNLAVTNRLTGPFAGRLPGFAVIEHVGRRSGRVRRTPVNLFVADERFVVALTYGRDSQWVRNVLAAGGCVALMRGRRVQLVDPEVVHDPARRLVPRPIASVLAVMGVDDFLTLRPRSP